jgi:mono/diheme cytochrome c family protein
MGMRENILTKSRRRFSYGLSAALLLTAAWWATPGLPVLRAPRASAETREAGRAIFEHEWEPHDAMAHGDGLGPVFNARSCVSCHFQGGVGGGGGNDHNVMAFEAHPTEDRLEVAGGLIHKFAVANHLLEDRKSLQKFFPIIPGGLRVVEGCQVLTRDFDPIRTQSINSTALFGAGWIDRISSKNITHQSLKKSLVRIGKELQADFTGIPAGRYRVLPDGRVGKFGWKAQFATLEEFVAAACANEIGLGNPQMEQARPRVEVEYPPVAPDLDKPQFRALVAFVDTLPQPVRAIPDDDAGRRQAERGEQLFAEIGCAHCHTPEIGGVAGIYSDFLLHSLDDRSRGGGRYGDGEIVGVPLPIDHPRPDEWKTPPLWGVADSAPYFHDGGSPTLADAIQRHEGDAEPVLQAYRKLPADDRDALLAFLKTLRAPGQESAPPPEPPARTTLASAR